MVTSPILVLVFSSILLREKLILKKILGIGIGLLGAIVLIVYGNDASSTSKHQSYGNFLVFVNTGSYGLDLVLDFKYHLIVEWLYLSKN